MTPDASKHNSRPAYARRLMQETGLTQSACAVRLGIGLRTLKRHLAEGAPYVVQFALEALAKGSK